MEEQAQTTPTHQTPKQNSSDTYCQSKLISWLKNPKNYQHKTTGISLIETHISTIFLTGKYAYKLKKPLDLGFLNFTRVSARKKYTHLELELNKRTAPEIYLTVKTIYQNHNNLSEFSFNNNSWKIVDYLVKMQQFNPNEVLGKKNQPLNPKQVLQLAQALAKLHTTSALLDKNSELSSLEAITQPMLDNFTNLLKISQSQLLKPSLSKRLTKRLNRLRLWTENQVVLFGPALEDRIESGHIRECHGDLHLDNIALIKDKPVIFDALEFSESLRWIDTISDLAFLLTDLDYRNQENLALNLLNEYLKITGDYKGLLILRFYQTYRSLVKAKITGLRYLQLMEQGQEEAQEKWHSLLNYISLAENYAFNTQASQDLNEAPTLYLMQGVSGTGKSTLAHKLANKTGAIHLSSDLERKRIYGIKPTERVSQQEKKTLYSSKMSGKTYDRLHHIAATSLQSGFSIILDATFLQAKHRQRFIELANLYKANHLIIALEPNKKLAKSWLENREKQNTDASDANYKIMQLQLETYEPPLPTENSITLAMGEKPPSLTQLQQLAGQIN